MLWLITFLVCAVVSNSQISGDGMCVTNVAIGFALHVWENTMAPIVVVVTNVVNVLLVR